MKIFKGSSGELLPLLIVTIGALIGATLNNDLLKLGSQIEFAIFFSTSMLILTLYKLFGKDKDV